MAELEGLLAGMRAKEFRTGLDVQKSGGQLGALVERNRLLQEQVATLQQQVIALQQSRDVQDRELSRLRSETLLLAKQTAAAAAAGQEGKGRGSRGSSNSGGGETAAAEELKGALADQVSTNNGALWMVFRHHPDVLGHTPIDPHDIGGWVGMHAHLLMSSGCELYWA